MPSIFRTTMALGAAGLIGFVSCSEGGNGGPVDPDPDPQGSIRATVNADGDPMGAVTVRVFADGGASALESGATASNGQVTFSDLDEGGYDVDVVLPAGFELVPGQTLRRDVAVVGEQVQQVTFNLREIVIPPTEGQVRVRVVDGGSGVEDVAVMLFTSGGATPLETLSTAADGRVLFDALTPGAYEVEITLPAGAQSAPGDTTWKTASVTAGQITDVQFGIDAPGPSVVEITVGGTSFSDDDVTIAPGTTVRWIWMNGDLKVTQTGHSEWTSTMLDGPGETFEHTFNNVGNFPYHCIPHQSFGMTGVIRVQ